MSRQPYPKYRPSGVEWLGEVPQHWDAIPLKRTFVILNGSTPRSSEPAYWDGEIPWATPDDLGDLKGNTLETTRRMISQEGYESCGTSLAPAGSLVLSTRAPIGHLAVAGISLCTNQGCRCLVFRNTDDHRFYYYQLLAAKGELESWGQGSTFRELSRDKLCAVRLLSPPSPEQRAIAAFLDRETARIDALIEKKQRQIELLQEKRTALIHQAIHHPGTKDLRLRHVANHVLRPIDRKDEEVYTAVGLYNWARGIFHKEPKAGFDLGDSEFFWLKSDDLILSGQFAWEGAVALANEEEEGCVVSHRYPVLRGKPDLMDTAYLWAFFTTKRGHFFLDDHSRGAAGRNRPLNINTLSKEVIPVPPLIEQRKVAEHVYFERRFKKVIASSIDLLQKYRAALISAVVTGKIDVRKEVA